MKHIMILSNFLLVVLTAGLGHVTSSPEAMGEAIDHPYDVYEVHEDSGKSFSFISPKSDKPTLREIIYYHIIEKPYSGNTDHSPQTGPDTDDTVKAFTNSHSGNQFLLDSSQVDDEIVQKDKSDKDNIYNIDPRYGSEARNPATNMDQTVESNDKNEEELDNESHVIEESSENVTETPDIPKKSVSRKLLFDLAREKYSRKKMESENPTTLQRSKRGASWSIPDGPRLPEIDWDSLPSYIRNILSSNKKPKNTPKSSPLTVGKKDQVQNKMATRRLSDRTENAEKTGPKTRGMDINSSNGVVWNDFSTNGIFNVGSEIKNENKKPEPAGGIKKEKGTPKTARSTSNSGPQTPNPKPVTETKKEEEVPKTALTITSSAAKEDTTRAPRTYGMNLTNGDGYTWNELFGPTRLPQSVTDKPDSKESASEDETKPIAAAEKGDATEKPTENGASEDSKKSNVDAVKVEPTENPTEKTSCDENKEKPKVDAEKVDVTEKPTENTTSTIENKAENASLDVSKEALLDNDKIPDWLASLTKKYMEQMIETMKTLIEKAVKEQMGERNATKGTQTEDLDDNKEDKKDPKLENDLDVNEEPIKDNKPAANSTDLPKDTTEAKLNGEDSSNKNATDDFNNNTDWVIEDRDASNSTDLPKDNTTATNNSTEGPSNIEDFKLKDFRDNYFEFVENKSKNNSSNATENKSPLPITVGANTLIGSSVGNDKVTNIFIFYPNNEVSELIDELKASHDKDDKSLDIAKFSESDSEETAENIAATEAPHKKDESALNVTTASPKEDSNKSTTVQDNPTTVTTTETAPTSASTTETVSTTQSMTEKVKDKNEVDSTTSTSTTERIEDKQDATSTSTTENPSTMPPTTKSTAEKVEVKNEVDSATSTSTTENIEISARTSTTENTPTMPPTAESTTKKSEDNEDVTTRTSTPENTLAMPATTESTTEKSEDNKDLNATSTLTPHNTSTMPPTTESTTTKIENENAATTLATENTQSTTESMTERVEVTSTTENTSTMLTTTETVDNKSDAEKKVLADEKETTV